MPHFETAVLVGPCPDIGLARGNLIVVVEVPWSNSAPHVHRDGRIYRRAGDSSEPRPETDRHLLDQLWQRSKDARKRLRTWIQLDPELSKAEAEVPYLRFMFCVDPWLQFNYPVAARLRDVREVLMSEEDGVPALVFDAVNPVPGGVLGRQVMGNNPRDFGLTVRLWNDLRFDVVMPVRVYREVESDRLAELLEGYVHGKRYVELLRSAGHREPNVVNLNMLILMLIGTIAKYRGLLRLFGGPAESVFVKVRTLNFWRVVSFIDVAEIIDDFEKYGVPVAMEESATWPSGDDPRLFVEMEEPQNIESAAADREAVVCSRQAWMLFALIAPMFGCSTVSFDWGAGGAVVPDLLSFDTLYGAGDRARKVERCMERDPQ